VYLNNIWYDGNNQPWSNVQISTSKYIYGTPTVAAGLTDFTVTMYGDWQNDPNNMQCYMNGVADGTLISGTVTISPSTYSLSCSVFATPSPLSVLPYRPYIQIYRAGSITNGDVSAPHYVNTLLGCGPTQGTDSLF
jgi:hypothetical protein